MNHTTIHYWVFLTWWDCLNYQAQVDHFKASIIFLSSSRTISLSSNCLTNELRHNDLGKSDQLQHLNKKPCHNFLKHFSSKIPDIRDSLIAISDFSTEELWVDWEDWSFFPKVPTFLQIQYQVCWKDLLLSKQSEINIPLSLW